MLKYYIVRVFATLLLIGYACAQAPPTINYEDIPNDLEGDAYKAFIQDLFNEIRDQHNACRHPGRPAEENTAVCIPYEGRNPTSFVDARLDVGDGHFLRARFRRDNLYLIGWRAEGTAAGEEGQWYELRTNTGTQLIPGGMPIGFGETYTALARAAGRTIEDTPVNQQALIQAGINLRMAIPGTGSSTTAGAVMTLIIMIAEAVRSYTVENDILRGWRQNGRAGLEVAYLAREWGTLSGEIARQNTFNDPQPLQAFFPQTQVEWDPVRYMAILIIMDCWLHVRLAIAQHPGGSGGSGGRLRLRRAAQRNMLAVRSRQDVAARAHGHNISKRQAPYPFIIKPGRPMFEIYSVTIAEVGGSNTEASLYGTIQANLGPMSYLIYNRDSNNKETVAKGEFLYLTGPTPAPNYRGNNRALNAADDVNIEFNLQKDGNYAVGSFEWSPFERDPGNYDTMLSFDVPSPSVDTTVTMKYVIMSNAAEAEIKIIWRSNNVDITGKFDAANSAYEGISDFVRLYQTGATPYTAKKDEPFPIQRTNVAVPLGYNLRVLLSVDKSPNHEPLVYGRIEFPAQLRMSALSQHITNSGGDGDIEVQVTWW